MTATTIPAQPLQTVAARSRGYLAYLAVFLGSVAIMDGYVSSIKSSAIPYISSAYGTDAPTFSALESLVLIPTFFIFAFNSLADRIGRRWSLLLLVALLMLMLGGVAGGWLLDTIGRRRGLVLSCLGITVCALSAVVLPGNWPAVTLILAAFFVGIASAWAAIYVPEVFPTERRATCVGWVSSIARIAYVLGPALAAVLLKTFPTMTGFWVIAGLVMLIPIGIIWLADPFETKTRSLEEIERER